MLPTLGYITVTRGVVGLREAHEALASARALGGRRPLADSNAAIEVSLGGLPPKGGGSEGERRSGATPYSVYPGLQGGLEDYGKRIRRMSESGALFHRAGTAIHPQGFKLV